MIAIFGLLIGHFPQSPYGHTMTEKYLGARTADHEICRQL